MTKGKIILVVGGSRSGKSNFAEKTASLESNKGNSQVLYVATAIPYDVDMEDRIEKHRQSRPQHWITLEKYSKFDELQNDISFIESSVILLDCLSVMITNMMFECFTDFESLTPIQVNTMEKTITEEVMRLLEVIRTTEKTIILVTNEVGMGLIPSYKLGSYFRDLSGRINQKVAEIADEVYFVAVGIPLKMK